MEPVVTALREQLDSLADLLDPLDDAGWALPSACPGWSIADVVLHLAQTNEMATASVEGRLAEAADEWSGTEAGDVDAAAEAAVATARGADAGVVHRRWRSGADEMVAAFAGCPSDRRVQWVAGEMAARTLATTRIAETWIHTEDIADGLGVDLPATDRLWHVARLIHRTLPYAFVRSGESPPGPVRFALDGPDGPDGDRWVFGDDGAPTVVSGTALDLCRVGGQRAQARDTALLGTGPDAGRVLALMRTFA